MWIFFGIFLSLSVSALESFEKIKNVKILRALSGNVIMLDRGLEDGLSKNDHIKISNDVAGFSSRAICLKSNAETSYWRIYRVPNSEAFSKDYLYTISGMSDKEIPYPEARIRDLEQEISEPPKKKELGADPFKLSRDLPERLTERDLIEATGPEQRKLFIEQAINKDQIQRDLRDHRVSIYASPFMKQSINQSESMRYGFRAGNVGSKYRLLTQFEQQQSKIKDPVTEESVSTRSTSGQAQFVIHRLNPDLSTLSLVNYNSARFSSFATPKSHWQIGPVGFTWHAHESKTWEYMDLSYVPLYDRRITEIDKGAGSKGIVQDNGLRHGFRFAVKTQINERVALENVLWVKPFQDLATWEIEADNLNLSNDLKLVFNLHKNLFFDYNFTYQKDKLWKTLSSLPESNTINSLNLRYDFDL